MLAKAHKHRMYGIEKLLSEVVSYYVDPDKCLAPMICARKCPVHGIEGAKGLIHVIDQQMSIECGSCLDACPEKFDAVKIITGVVPRITRKPRARSSATTERSRTW